MMEIIIDGEEYECERGQKVLDVAEENGISIPTFCYNPLNEEERPAACRMCVVEVLGGGEETQLETSCSMPVSDGLEVSTKSKAVYNERREVLELLLSEHQQDCRDCSISGDCKFAEYCGEYDLDGVSVCAECPRQGEGCFLSKGVLCLGPITFANCDAFCTTRGDPCEGCYSVLSNEDVLKIGLRAFEDAGFDKDEVLEAAKVFSYEDVQILQRLIKEEELFE